LGSEEAEEAGGEKETLGEEKREDWKRVRAEKSQGEILATDTHRSDGTSLPRTNQFCFLKKKKKRLFWVWGNTAKMHFIRRWVCGPGLLAYGGDPLVGRWARQNSHKGGIGRCLSIRMRKGRQKCGWRRAKSNPERGEQPRDGVCLMGRFQN